MYNKRYEYCVKNNNACDVREKKKKVQENIKGKIKE